ncbi:MAG: hypothetical protein GX811_07105, partial [Lentisphaerae bacterium]|nr:hypothetical protein [Lentisphaerota bacterium]
MQRNSVEKNVAKEKKIDSLLGSLSLEQKAGQLLVIGLTGPRPGPDLAEFIKKYNISGLRTSPIYARKFIRYLPDGSPGIENVVRPPRFNEKLWDETIRPHYVKASEYAKLLNELRIMAMERDGQIPLHYAVDYESGEASNFLAPGMVTLPAAMGLGFVDAPDLVARAMEAAGRQLKSVGFDMVHSPVADVNTNPRNPGISTRAYGEECDIVTKCARACLKGLHAANIIGCAKHFPGQGAAENDAHYGMATVKLDRETMMNVHVEPYRKLCEENILPSVMLAHGIYPTLDETETISTVSPAIITGILREELGFNGVITTDSITMGGLMARHSVKEATVLAINAGVDIVLLKDDNALR